jgi:predicted metal-dependent hydrolase
VPITKLTLAEGAKFPYLGSYKTLQLTPTADQNTLTVTKTSLILTHSVPLDDKLIHSVIRRWYIDTARELLTAKTQFWGKKIGVYPSRIMIKEQKTRWGSCSSLKNINYNWRIIMATEDIIDYLVVHEVCHLHHMNHSAEFWQLVETYIPHYQDCRKWLKINGAKLILD